MRAIKAQEFGKDYQFQAAKRKARKLEVGRLSGRRGTQAWGNWSEVN